MASRSARASSASSTSAMPCSRNWSIRARSLSRIVIPPGLEREEVAGDLLEDEVFQAREVEQPVSQGLLDRGDERTGWIGAPHLDQPAQGTPVARAAVLSECRGIAVEAVRMVCGHRNSPPGGAVPGTRRTGMVWWPGRVLRVSRWSITRGWTAIVTPLRRTSIWAGILVTLTNLPT